MWIPHRRRWTAAILSIAAACGGKDSPPAGAGPQASVSPLVQDLGEVLEGQSARCEFRVHNQGTEDLLIKKIRAACSCVVAQMPNRRIPPGSSVTIPVEFLSLYRFGENDRQLTVFTNDPGHPQLVLRVQASVTRLLELEPPVLDLGQELVAADAHAELRIRARDGQDFEVLSLTSPDPAVQLEWLRVPGDVPTWKVVAWLAEEVPADWSARVPLIAEVRHPVHTRFKIPVAGELLAPVIVEPAERLDLGAYGPAGPAVGEIRIQARVPGKPCPVIRATLATEANLHERKPDGSYKEYASVRVLMDEDGSGATLRIEVAGALPLPLFAGLVQIRVGTDDRPSHTVLVNAVREETR